MPVVKLKIKVRIEELPAISGFIHDSLVRDLADFTDFSPKYNAAFVVTLEGKMAAARAVINPKQLTAEQVLITQGIAGNLFALQDIVSKLEGYVTRASGLTVAVKNFGIKEVRKAYSRDDQEGLDGALSYLLGNVDNNMAALTAEGYSAAKRGQLADVQSAVNAANLGQNAKQSERSTLAESNYIVFNDLWDMLMDICDLGKRLYKVNSVSKKDDYTVAALKSRMRQEQLKTMVSGVVTAGGAPAKGAKIVAKPAAGGRTKTVYAKADGSYELKGLVAADMIVTATATGLPPLVKGVTVVSGETEVLDFGL